MQFHFDDVGDNGARWSDADDLAGALELPRRGYAAGETVADAGVAQQVVRLRGVAVPAQIGGGGGAGETLGARADRDSDHVALEALVVADAGVEAGGEHVDKLSSAPLPA